MVVHGGRGGADGGGGGGSGGRGGGEGSGGGGTDNITFLTSVHFFIQKKHKCNNNNLTH